MADTENTCLKCETPTSDPYCEECTQEYRKLLDTELKPPELPWDTIHERAGRDPLDIAMDYVNGRTTTGGLIDAIADYATAAYQVGADPAPTVDARGAAEEIARETNGGDRDDFSYPVTLVALLEDPTIDHERGFADWLEAIILRHVTARDGSRWQPIETAPKDGTHVLLWATGAFYGCVVGRYNSRANNRGGGWLAERFPVPKPTHWMPLPKPPVTARSGGEGER
jgi:hypothetical protein